MRIFRSILYIVLLLSFIACNKEESTPSLTSSVEVEKVLLGKRLFFDKGLSSNGRVSCATCHEPALAFSDGVATASTGVSGDVLVRNSPTLVNVANQTEFFWDGGAKDLLSQALGPLTSPHEMNVDLKELIDYLSADPSYQESFNQVYALEDSLRIYYVQDALAAFQTAIVSTDSKYDKYLRGDFQLSATALEGEQLFKVNCASCHNGSDLRDGQYHNNGLDAGFMFSDVEDERWGRYRITNAANDIGAYKTPTLRNISLTAPYMHDGRLEDLAAVIEHYSDGIVSSGSLSDRLPVGGFKFNEREKEALESFLLCLTDSSFINNPLWKE